MTNYQKFIPYALLAITLALELLAFLTSYMITSRNLQSLHEGLFRRCIYPIVTDPRYFYCFWWTSDTFNVDRGSLQFSIIQAFISLFLVGFTLIFGMFSYFYKTLRSKVFDNIVIGANCLNVMILISIIIVYTFVYATDTRVIPSYTTPLVFSWSWYILFAALGANILSSSFFLYNRLRAIPK